MSRKGPWSERGSDSEVQRVWEEATAFLRGLQEKQVPGVKSGFRKETDGEPLVSQTRLWVHSRGHGVQRAAASPRPRRAEQEADKHEEGGNDQLSHFIYIHIVFYVV